MREILTMEDVFGDLNCNLKHLVILAKHVQTEQESWWTVCKSYITAIGHCFALVSEFGIMLTCTAGTYCGQTYQLLGVVLVLNGPHKGHVFIDVWVDNEHRRVHILELDAFKAEPKLTSMSDIGVTVH